MISKNLKALRLSLGLTQQQFADLINVSRSTINKWEHNDKVFASLNILKKICEKCNVTLDDLVFNDIK